MKNLHKVSVVFFVWFVIISCCIYLSIMDNPYSKRANSNNREGDRMHSPPTSRQVIDRNVHGNIAASDVSNCLNISVEQTQFSKTANDTESCSGTSPNNLPKNHQNKMIVTMIANKISVPFYFFTFEYKYPRYAHEPDLKKNRMENSSEQKMVLYVKKDEDGGAPPVISNKVMAEILQNLTKGYKDFKTSLLDANKWLHESEFFQDDFFILKLELASDLILNCDHSNLSLWSTKNMMEYCLGPTKDEEVANLISRINTYRAIGFSAHLDHKRSIVEVLVHHNHRNNVDEQNNDI